MKKPPIVEIEWIDAAEEQSEHRLSVIDDKVTLKHRLNVGYLVNDKPDRVSISFGIDPPESADDELEASTFLTIPRGWIKRIRYVGGGPRAKKETTGGTASGSD